MQCNGFNLLDPIVLRKLTFYILILKWKVVILILI